MAQTARSSSRLLGSTEEERRTHLLEALGGIVEYDHCAVFGLVGDGELLRYDRIVTQGSGRALWETGRGVPYRGPWDPLRPARGEADRFVPTSTEPGAVREIFYEPLGLGQELRMLVYDGDRFVAWVGVSRQRDRPQLGEGELVELNRHRERLAAGLRASSAVARPLDSLQWAYLTLHADGRLESASAAAEPQLSQELRRELAGVVRSGTTLPCVVPWGGLLVELVRLDAGDSERIVGSIRASEELVTPLVRLTEAQRAVSELAAVGATVPEIASALGLSPHTVRQHLKSTYKRLDVGARVELAALHRQAARFGGG